MRSGIILKPAKDLVALLSIKFGGLERKRVEPCSHATLTFRPVLRLSKQFRAQIFTSHGFGNEQEVYEKPVVVNFGPEATLNFIVVISEEKC